MLFSRAHVLLKELGQARVDHTFEKTFRRFLARDLLILNDFGLRRLTAQQSQDLYELIIERHRRSSFAFTSNRGVDAWLALFDDPILGNSALDRLANATHQVIRGLGALSPAHVDLTKAARLSRGCLGASLASGQPLRGPPRVMEAT